MIRMMRDADEPQLAQLFLKGGVRPFTGSIPPCSGWRILPSRPGVSRSGWRRRGQPLRIRLHLGRRQLRASPLRGGRLARAGHGACLAGGRVGRIPVTGLPQGGHPQHHGDGLLPPPGLAEHGRDRPLRHHGALARAHSGVRPGMGNRLQRQKGWGLTTTGQAILDYSFTTQSMSRDRRLRADHVRHR